MIDYKLLKNFDIKPKSFSKKKSTILVETSDDKYIFKDHVDSLEETFKYLDARNFNYYPSYKCLNDKYDVYEYLEDYNLSSFERASELINLVSILHSKTTHYKNISLDDYKIIYEDISGQIDHLYNYYSDINSSIEQEIYMAPSKYLLVRNISKIYSLINFCKEELENWYDLIKDSDKSRVVLVHNNLELDHLIRNENSYLISWENSKFDSPIYDLYKFYKNSYDKVDFSLLFDIYNKRYPLNESEIKLFFILISLPDRISFSNNDYDNTLIVNKLLKYIYKTDGFISPYYSENQEE